MSDSDRPSLSPRHWPAWLGVGCLWVLAQFPQWLARPLGAAFGSLLYVALGWRRRVARRNLELCFPELPPRERAKLLRANFRSLGIGAFEFMRAWWGPIGGLATAHTISGLEHLERARAEGRGVLLMSGHFHSFELCGRLLTLHHAAGAMYRPHEGSVFDWAVKRGRGRYAQALFARDDVRAALKYLRRGGVLWYAPDQDMRGRDTVFVPFFGVPANTITATHQMARVGNALVIPFRHRRARHGLGYEIALDPPLENFPSEDPAADAARINAVIEDLVRNAPEEYLWIHRRFKRRPTGEARVYD